ncbi:MAG: hypothetical protein ACK4YP_16765 [Myxococcota bacterium]
MAKRWDYMRSPGFNPPSTACRDHGAGCTGPSRAYFIGAKTVEGQKQVRYRCEHGHEWIVRED